MRLSAKWARDDRAHFKLKHSFAVRKEKGSARFQRAGSGILPEPFFLSRAATSVPGRVGVPPAVFRI